MERSDTKTLGTLGILAHFSHFFYLVFGCFRAKHETLNTKPPIFPIKEVMYGPWDR